MATPGVIKITWVESAPRADRLQLAWGSEGVELEGVVLEWATGPAPQGEAGRRLVQAVLASLGCEMTEYAPARMSPDWSEAGMETRPTELCLSGVS